MKMPKAIKHVLQRVISPARYTLLTSEIKRRLAPKAKSYVLCKILIRQKSGFEIGGPSPVFSRSGLLPIYTIADRVDNCNFSQNTIWEGTLEEGLNFFYDKAKQPGHQYIRDAVDLHGIPSAAYDFVLSSHNIEHIANPLRALREWLRIVKDNGLIVLVVPHKDGTFDHLRPVTKLDHLIEDFERGVGEEDLTHLEEILELHDLGMDPGRNDLEAFRIRSEHNFENRCLHQHVFDTKLATELLDYLGVEISSVEALLPMHIIVVGKKLPVGVIPDNTSFLSDCSEYRSKSPFPSDRIQKCKF